MRTFGDELRQAGRSLLRRKAYFLTCAATLTLVLGANAAMFAVVNATMLRPMPFATQGPVVQLFSQPPGTTAVSQRNPLQQMELPRLRERARTLARIEGFLLSERVITLGGEPVVAQTAAVTPGLLPMLAAGIRHGRTFTNDEGTPGHFVAVISHRYWRDVLGSASVIDTPLVIDGQPHTIVGILPSAFHVPFVDAHIFTPLVANAEPLPRAPPRSVVSLAELVPGASLEQARSELGTISAEFAQEFPKTHPGWSLGAEWAREWQYGSMRAPMLVLLAATLFVLLIACVNIANLTSADAVARSSELSLRLALGASRRDVLRIHFAELLIVCASGLIPGLLLAQLAVPALLSIDPAIARTLGVVAIDWRVQAFSAGVAVLTAFLASTIPAIRAMRGDIRQVLAAGATRTTGSRRAVFARRLLVSMEIALCLALLMAGAVLLRGLRDLDRRGPGFDASSVLTAQIRLPENPYRTPELRAQVVKQLLDGVRHLPGVESASTTQNAFLPGFSYQTLLHAKARPTPDGQARTVQLRRVSGDYFDTLRIRTIRGRTITDEDIAGTQPIVVVSKQFAETILAGLDPIGQILVRAAPPEFTIVGVVDDALDVSATSQPEPTVYFPWAQNNNFGVPVALVIRTSVEPESLVSAVRNAVKAIDPALPLRKAQPLDAFVNESMAPERFRTIVLGIIGVLGLALAMVGISGVTYRGVLDRRRDFAVRLALGSEPAGVIRLVMIESLRDLALGTMAGIAAGAGLSLLLASWLQHVGSMDAVSIGVATGVIALVSVVAALVPALRLRRIQPAEVLRS